jgi:hypothetical protein
MAASPLIAFKMQNLNSIELTTAGISEFSDTLKIKQLNVHVHIGEIDQIWAIQICKLLLAHAGTMCWLMQA